MDYFTDPRQEQPADDALLDELADTLATANPEALTAVQALAAEQWREHTGRSYWAKRCPTCQKMRDYLTKHGNCTSCNLERAHAGRIDKETQTRLDKAVELGKDKETPHRARKWRKIGGRR